MAIYDQKEEYVGVCRSNREISNGCCSSIPDPGQPRQIDNQCINLDANISRLMDLVSVLSSRLSPILIDLEEGATPDPGCNKEQPLVPVANTIRRFNITVSYAISKLESILNRIEV